MNEKSKYIKGFNGLRALSILFVMMDHMDLIYIDEKYYFPFSGPGGVNMFFGISGFLITSILLQEDQKNGTINLKNFFVRRFLRLVPALIPFYFMVALLMHYDLEPKTYKGIFASLFYLTNYTLTLPEFWNGCIVHTWSLAVEEQFYIIWAVVMKYFKTKVFTISFVLIGLSLIAVYIIPHISIMHEGKLKLLDNVYDPHRWTIPAIGPIIIGSLIALTNYHYKELTVQLVKQKIYIIIVVALILFTAYAPECLTDYAFLFHALGCSLLLLWIYHNQETKFVSILEFKPLAYLGVISYGIYIWQGFFIRVAPWLMYKHWHNETPVNILLTVAVAIISYEFYEKKVLKLKSRFH